ncbi:MAG TPA: fumarate reductase cytochrome b subunit [Pelomicrobium sp.]|nr:fumarate reductase cytochrome b subunit [Pelomicrobium sp.]
MEVIAGVGLADRPRKSRWPARLDFWQSATGLFLGLFMWGHMFFVATILISKDAMWAVTKMFEGYYIFGTAHPILVSGVVALVFVAFIAHAFLAMRKFPANYRQYRAFIGHKNLFRHTDTTLWWVQFVTGFLLFFLGSAHLYQMLMNPGAIGPYASGERVFTSWWPLYLVLLFAVELHGGIGLYRLSVKWGWFGGKDPDATRKRLSMFKWALTVFFLVLGLLTLAAYYKIGWENRDDPGIRFTPTWAQDAAKGGPR